MLHRFRNMVSLRLIYLQCRKLLNELRNMQFGLLASNRVGVVAILSSGVLTPKLLWCGKW